MQRLMSQAKTAFVLLVVFFAGCAASAASHLVVPPARADTNPQRWEYACGSGASVEKVATMAAQMGQQGWEMSGVSGAIWCFKRPLP
jgi:hypothetical protein